MHKKLLLIFCCFLLIGCTRIDQVEDYSILVSSFLQKPEANNSVSLGYVYYVPKGIKKIHDYDYNHTFLIDDDYLYLYVDIISYYYKKNLSIASKDGLYYYQDIRVDDKNGYLAIKEDGNRYLVKFVFHYAKIEAVVEKEKINKIVTLSSIILNSIQYNDIVIERVMSGNLGEFSEMSYEIEKPSDAGSNFSQYLEESVQKEDEKKEDKKKTNDLSERGAK